MIGNREREPETLRGDVGLERAKAIWTFRSGQLVETLWDFLEDRRACASLDPEQLLNDLAEVLAGDDLPPLRAIDAPALRPAVPPNGHPGRGAAKEPGA
jgi:hypothetical protein